MIAKLLDTVAALLAYVMGLGLLIGFIPAAIVFPEHGQVLVRIQAGGVAVFGLALLAFFITGILAALWDKVKDP